MNLTKAIRLFFIALVVICAIYMAGQPRAYAGGHGVTQSNDMNNQTTGDVDLSTTTEGSKALALGNTLGDVDIAGCLGSTQWNSPLFGKQKLVLNQVCMAEFYLKNGKYELAAMALCNVPEILKEFDTEVACEKAHDFGPPPQPVIGSQPEPVSYIDHNEDIVQVQMAQNDITTRVDDLEARLSRPRPRSTTVVKEKGMTDAQRAAIRAALYGDGDDEDE